MAESPPSDLQDFMAPILVRSEAFASGVFAGWLWGVPGADR